MEKRSLKIYIAAPYSAETEEERRKNTEVVIDAALALFQEGHFPYIPHLTHWVDKCAKETNVVMEYESEIRGRNTNLLRGQRPFFKKTLLAKKITLPEAEKPTECEAGLLGPGLARRIILY